MKNTKPNARFWFYVSVQHGWVKLTLKPGSLMKLSGGGATDEGYQRWYEFIGYDAHDMEICNTSVIESRDCDGRLDSYTGYHCPVESLKSRKATVYGDNGETGEILDAPAWIPGLCSQRDYSAEEAGY